MNLSKEYVNLYDNYLKYINEVVLYEKYKEHEETCFKKGRFCSGK